LTHWQQRAAGLDNSKGILSAGYQMDVTDPQWDSYPGMQRFRAFMAKYYPEADRSESGDGFQHLDRATPRDTTATHAAVTRQLKC